MEIVQRVSDKNAIISLRGEFTFGARQVFNEAMEKSYAGGCTHIIVNLEGVRFVDSAALGLLALTYNRCKFENRRLSLVKPQPYVQEILKLANIDRMIPIYGSEEAAMAVKGAAPAMA